MDQKTTDRLLTGILVALIAVAVVGGLVESVRGQGEDAAGLLPKGAVAPAFVALRHADKKVIQSAQLAGKVVVLDFWGTWCPPCREEAPVVRDVARSYAKQPEVVVLAMDWEDGEGDPQASVDAFMKEKGLQDYPVVYPTPEVLQRFQVSRFPTLYVIGKDGKIRYRSSGMVSGSRLRDEIDAALKG